jgi:hypothetical protein
MQMDQSLFGKEISGKRRNGGSLYLVFPLPVSVRVQERS